ncbi:MAG: glutamine-hydrolyzing carbamoyl-phosphate synthase small subunit [Acidimicrobiales bacterium]
MPTAPIQPPATERPPDERPAARDERPAALLVLADGTTFEGEAIGALMAQGSGAPATGEVVFNTVMTGYQEVLTDPSYSGQIIAFTYPHIGNYGVTPTDDESPVPHCRGVVVRDLPPRPSSWRCAEDLESFLVRHRIPGIAGVDTRRLTRRLRSQGSLAGAMGVVEGPDATTPAALRAAAAGEAGTEGLDLVSALSTNSAYQRPSDAPGALCVVAFDYGLKSSQLRYLRRWAAVDVVPARTPASEVLALRPDGVFLSNGPGDPAGLPWAVRTVRDLLGEVPVFGICLGHQILATALGARTYKLAFGHHGGNHPVRAAGDGHIEITSHNHNYAVAPDSFDTALLSVTHTDLNDGVIEGLRSSEFPAFSVQYHPEAGPGPHDAAHLFAGFKDLIAEFREVR